MEDVLLQLAPEDPEAVPWRVEPLSTVIDAVLATRPREAVAAGRREVMHLIDALIWVQSDQRVAERRRLTRDREPSALDTANLPSDGSLPDHDGWMAEEIPFNTDQCTWERADIVVCGTPEITCDAESEVVVGPPPTGADVRLSRPLGADIRQ